MRATLLALVLLTPATGLAQVERYELGRRLVQFEGEWEFADPAGRKRALAILPAASTQFLSLRLGEAARTIEDARRALNTPDPMPAAQKWLRRLYVVPDRRLFDPRRPLVAEVRELYPVPGKPPAGAVVLADLSGGPGGGVMPYALPQRLVALTRDPLRLAAKPIIGGDTGLSVRFLADGEYGFGRSVGVSVTTDPDARLNRLAGTPPPGGLAPLEAATLAGRLAVLRGLAAGDPPETDVPAVRLLQECEEMVAAGKPYFTPERPGDHWLTVPTGTDAATACRLFVPEELPATTVPLVVALHGAGGSENMFFESYGAGHIVKECRKRGWLLVSPRSGLLGTPPVAAIVEKLAERYPIDRKRVFLVGHSMGAGQAIDLVQRLPGTFAAVASLGGGGRVRQKERFEMLPVFVGVGTADFALRSSRSLVKALADAGAKSVTAKEYPDLEHLLIVREALPDVFKMFDGVKP